MLLLFGFVAVAVLFCFVVIVAVVAFIVVALGVFLIDVVVVFLVVLLSSRQEGQNQKHQKAEGANKWNFSDKIKGADTFPDAKL